MLTIQDHEQIVGSRFQLAQLIMKRVNQFYTGAAPCKGMPKEFSRKNFWNIPNHRWQKIALEEIRLKKLKWERTNPTESVIIKPIEENPVVFTE